MYCKMCGKYIDSNADICPDCLAQIQQPQPVAQPIQQPIVQPTVQPVMSVPPMPVKTGSVLALSIISKILIVLAFIGALVSAISIFALVISYNFEYVIGVTLTSSSLPEFLAAADMCKVYAIYIAAIAFSSIVLAVVALILAKINKKKGFPSKLVKVFFILSLVFGCIAIGNCTLNYFLFGRYETYYYYI